MVADASQFSEVREYLRARGIDEFTQERLDLRIMGSSKLADLGITWSGIQFGITWPIKDRLGEFTGKIGARVFYHSQAPSFLDQLEKGKVKQPKFLTPKGQTPEPYYSPLKDWSKIQPGDKVVICESFLKADTAARLGFYAVGISGVWGWSHKRELCDGFWKSAWSDYDVSVCFDSGVTPEHPELFMAVQRFSANMATLCDTTVGFIQLPPPADGHDWGLDDYCAEHGDDATRELLSGDSQVVEGSLYDHLLIMNREVAVVRSMSRIVEIETGTLHKPGDFQTVRYANRSIVDPDDGRKSISIPRSWLGWKDRLEVERLVYNPGDPRYVEDDYYNLWQGMGCEPVEGDVSLFTDWLDDFFTDGEAKFFCDWWAWQLQNLGGKLNTSLVLVGTSGVGKGWTASIMQRIFGVDNVAKNSLDQLINKFNSDLGAAQLLIVEEAGAALDYQSSVYTKLKDMTTNELLRVERKGVDSFMVKNRLNIFLSGNDIDMVKLDPYDRRLAILEPKNIKYEKDAEYWQKRWDWIDEGGAESVYWWLLQRDLSGFDAKGAAPDTVARRDMILATHSGDTLWIEDLRHDPAGVLGDFYEPVLSAKELYWIYRDGAVSFDEIEPNTIKSFTKKLSRARLARWDVNASGKVKDPRGNNTRWFLLDAKMGAIDLDGSPAKYIKSRKISGLLYDTGSGKY